MFLSQQFGDRGRDAEGDPDQGPPDGPALVPTHLLTMTRGAAEAVPERLISALRAMGIPALALQGRGLGLVLTGAVPDFLQRDPFRVTPLEDSAPDPVAEPDPDPEPPPEPDPPPLLLRPEDQAGAEEAEAEEEPEPMPPEPETPDPAEDAPDMPENDGDAAPELRADKIDRILERLDLIEFLISEEGKPSGGAGPDDRLAGLESGLARLAEAVSRLEPLCRAAEEAVTRLAARPAPALDLTAQQRGFAAFGAAMATFQNRIAAAADRMERSQAALQAEARALLARPPTGEGGSVELEAMASLVAVLSDRLAAAQAAPDPAPNLAAALDGLRQTQERVAASLARMQELPDTRMQAAQEEFLRDVRLIIAELLAENRRVAVS